MLIDNRTQFYWWSSYGVEYIMRSTSFLSSSISFSYQESKNIFLWGFDGFFSWWKWSDVTKGRVEAEEERNTGSKMRDSLPNAVSGLEMCSKFMDTSIHLRKAESARTSLLKVRILHIYAN